MHNFNVKHNKPGEEYLWTPEVQEDKVSQYGSHNIRYNRYHKKRYIEQFKHIHKSIVNWQTIRYIF